MKVAILHEMLVKLGGAEKVVSVFLEMFPEADLFTLMYDEKKVEKDFPKSKISSQVFSLPTQKLYAFTKKQRLCLPLMPRSVEKLDFSEYDLVLVSSSGFAHGANVSGTTKMIVYSHSPARYMWDWTNEYKQDIGFSQGIRGLLLGTLFYKLRQWDYYAAQKADLVLANSNNTRSRVMKYHRRNAKVLYPPVETERFSLPSNPLSPLDSSPLSRGANDYYIIISALTEFKRLDIAIDAFNNMPDKTLLIIGAGEYADILQKQSQENIHFAGAKYGHELVALVQGSLGLIFPGEEDFGIVPIEVMAAGKPIFAFQKGGLLETVVADKTGAFFNDPKGSDFVANFQLFHNKNTTGWFKSKDCREQAEKYSTQIFQQKLRNYIDNTI